MNPLDPKVIVIEHVAKAIFCEDEVSRHVPSWDGGELKAEIKDIYRRMARAAVDAMDEVLAKKLEDAAREAREEE